MKNKISTRPTKNLVSKILISLSAIALFACNNGVSNQSPSQSDPAATTVSEPNNQQDNQTSQKWANRGTGEACQFVESGFGPSGQVEVRAEEVVSGLEVPWGLIFLENGDMLVSERAGRIRLVQNNQLQPTAIANIEVTASGEGGLLDIEAHPDFANNRFFYVYYTADAAGTPVNRVERWQLSADGQSAQRDRVIVDNIPVARFHNGGRMRFGPDDMLYIGTGDATEPETSQDVNTLAGKILRVTPEGEIPDDNPFADSPVFLTGIRNTQGFDWYNESTLWVSDHGPSGELGRRGQDKVSVATAGDNLGWPTLQGCESQEGLISPALIWQEAVPPGGAAIYTGEAIPEWQGNLIIGTLGSEHLHRVVFDPKAPYRIQAHEVYFGDGTNSLGRIREVIMGPDNELYITTSNCDGRGTCPPEGDKIVRITR
jgi:glucose/arabinose dehydrogenase